jgi:hypothetical protein
MKRKRWKRKARAAIPTTALAPLPVVPIPNTPADHPEVIARGALTAIVQVRWAVIASRSSRGRSNEHDDEG